MADELQCPKGHTRVWKKGVVPTRQGLKVRYLCYICGRTFYLTPAKKSQRRRKG